jgi:cadmium resistance protein CadD (predicted permease)
MGDIWVGIFAFTATNLDDFILLLLLLSSGKYPVRQVFLAQILGMTGIVSLSLAAAYFSTRIVPESAIKIFGLIPIGLGIHRLFEPSAPSALKVGEQDNKLSVFALAATFLACGGDNLAVYVPLFAKSLSVSILSTLLVFPLMTLVWCVLASLLSRRELFQFRLRQVGAALFPYALIAIGILVIFR